MVGLIDRHFLLVWSLQERSFERCCTWLSLALQASGFRPQAGGIFLDGEPDDNAKQLNNLCPHYALLSV